MNYDDLLQRYFGSPDPSKISAAALVTGADHLRVDLGLERDRERRFALWSVLYMLGQAPDLDIVFEDESDREAARNLMDLFGAAAED